MSYTYGYNIDSDILSEYCTYAVGAKVILARMGSNSPDGLSWLEAGDLGSHMNTNYRERLREYRREMRRIEEDHFPSRASEKDLAMVIF
jgi:hypothetical protein